MNERRLSPPRARFNRAVTRWLDRAQVGLARHWLALINGVLACALVLALTAPLLVALGYPQLASPIYWVYQAVCHQWPFRSFFLFGPQMTYGADQIVALAGADQLWTLVGAPTMGYKMAFCERDFAIVTAGLTMGLMYVRVRRRLAPPHLLFYAGLLLPIILDGTTQLGGWRESTWEYRLATGAIAGAATVWLILPYLEVFADRWLLAATWIGADTGLLPTD